jgi:hypothetical protein
MSKTQITIQAKYEKQFFWKEIFEILFPTSELICTPHFKEEPITAVKGSTDKFL